MSDLEQYLATLEEIRHKHQVHQINTINFEEACCYRGLHTFWRISETDRVPRRSTTDGRQRKTRINNELKRGVLKLHDIPCVMGSLTRSTPRNQ